MNNKKNAELTKKLNDKEAGKWARTFAEVALYECIEEGLITPDDVEKYARRKT